MQNPTHYGATFQLAEALSRRLDDPHTFVVAGLALVIIVELGGLTWKQVGV